MEKRKRPVKEQGVIDANGSDCQSFGSPAQESGAGKSLRILTTTYGFTLQIGLASTFGLFGPLVGLTGFSAFPKALLTGLPSP